MVKATIDNASSAAWNVAKFLPKYYSVEELLLMTVGSAVAGILFGVYIANTIHSLL